MKIRRKIALIFTALTIIVIFLAFAFIYYLSAKYTENDFYARLEEKATLAAWKNFEQDELSKQAYEKVIDNYLQSMPGAEEIILNMAEPQLIKDSLSKILPSNSLSQKIQKGEKIKFRNHDKQGIGIYYPDNQGTFIIIVMAFDKVGIHKERNLAKILSGIFFGSIILIFFMGQLYARRVLAPVVNIIRNVRKINATNLSLRLKEKKGNDELTELTSMFNQMLERLDNSFAMQKRFISNASHELKNPLTAILGETEIALGKGRKVPEYVKALQNIEAEAERLNLLTKNLLDLGQLDFDLSVKNKEEIQLDNLLFDIKEYFDKTEYKDRLKIDNLLQGQHNLLTIQGNYNLIQIALTNLIDNACKFSGQQKVFIKLHASGTDTILEIIDEGIGIPENEVINMCQPFSRASNAFSFKGSGIGLSLADRIIKLHGGHMDILPGHNKGTRVKIRFLIPKS